MSLNPEIVFDIRQLDRRIAEQFTRARSIAARDTNTMPCPMCESSGKCGRCGSAGVLSFPDGFRLMRKMSRRGQGGMG